MNMNAATTETRCAAGKHLFNNGGARTNMPSKYIGKQCCGGDKLAGDAYGKQWQCKRCPYKAYVCGKCRKELTLTGEQMTTVTKSKSAAEAKQAVRAKALRARAHAVGDVEDRACHEQGQ